MVRKVVTVDEGLHLPTAVQTQLRADLDADFASYVSDAQTASSNAELSAISSGSARDAAVTAASSAQNAKDNIEATIAAWAIDTSDSGITSVVSDTGSDTRSLLDTTYAKRLDSGNRGVPRIFNVTDYGAVGNGSTNSTAGIQAAIDAAGVAGGGTVFLPSGIYQTTSALLLGATPGVRLVGAGRGNTWIRASDTTSNVIEVTNAAYIAIGDLSITRNARGTTGSGIVYSGPGEAAYNDLFNLHILDQYRGIHAMACTFGFMRKVVVEGCSGDGLFFTNSATTGAIQWELDGILSQRNGGNGFRVYAQNLGVGQITMGSWRGIYTFGNSGSGVRLEGVVGCPIYDFRMSDFFVGEDGDSEIYFDTHGGMHTLSGAGMIELCGRRTTGPTVSTPASGMGHGILIGGSEVDVTIGGGIVIWSNSQCGIFALGGNVTVGNVHLKENGVSALNPSEPGWHSGIFVSGADVAMSGVRSTGSKWGAYAGTDTVMFVGNRLKGTTAGIGNGVTLTNSLVANNRVN